MSDYEERFAKKLDPQREQEKEHLQKLFLPHSLHLTPLEREKHRTSVYRDLRFPLPGDDAGPAPAPQNATKTQSGEPQVNTSNAFEPIRFPSETPQQSIFSKTGNSKFARSPIAMLLRALFGSLLHRQPRVTNKQITRKMLAKRFFHKR